MKRKFFLCAMLSIFALFPSFGEMREWTNTEGKKIEGQAISKTSTDVVIKLSNGREAKIKIDQLSEEDQEYLTSWQPSEEKKSDQNNEKKAVDAANVKFKWNKSEKGAFKQAEDTGLPVLILFTGTSWCPYCVKLEDEVLKKRDFQQGMNGVAIGLICISEGGGKYKGAWAQKLAQKYKVTGVPKMIVVNAKGEQLGSPLGYMKGTEPTKYVEMIKQRASKGEK